MQGVYIYEQVVSLQLLPRSYILPSQGDLILRSITKVSPTASGPLMVRAAIIQQPILCLAICDLFRPFTVPNSQTYRGLRLLSSPIIEEAFQ